MQPWLEILNFMFSYVHAEKMEDHSEILSTICSEKSQLP